MTLFSNRGHRITSLLLAVMLFVSVGSIPSLAAMPARPENKYVLDSAGVLTKETTDSIVAKNTLLSQQGSGSLVVAVVQSLEGQPIAEYAESMFQSWGVSSAGQANGFLLLLSIDDDTYFALPGSSLESTFTADKIKQLLNDHLETDFTVEDYNAGVRKAFDAIAAEMDAYNGEQTQTTTSIAPSSPPVSASGNSAASGDTSSNGSLLTTLGIALAAIGVLSLVVLVSLSFYHKRMRQNKVARRTTNSSGRGGNYPSNRGGRPSGRSTANHASSRQNRRYRR